MKNEAGVLSEEFAIDETMPHFSFEFEYKSRGAAFDWSSKAHIDKSMPSILPFREAWKVNGPTLIEFEAAPTAEFFSVTINNKKIDVESATEANGLLNDSGAILFGDNVIDTQIWADGKAASQGKLDVVFKKSANGFQKYRVYINPENGVVLVQTSYAGADKVLKAVFPESFFSDRRYISFTTSVAQNIKIRDLSVTAVNEYAMSKQVPWLKKRDAWKLNDKVSVFEFEADNRDCYFVCHPTNEWPIKHDAGAFVIFYGWDNTKSIIMQDGR